MTTEDIVFPLLAIFWMPMVMGTAIAIDWIVPGFDSRPFSTLPYYRQCDKVIQADPKFDGTYEMYDEMINQCIGDRIQQHNEELNNG